MQLSDNGMNGIRTNATYVQPLHSADLPAGLHGLVDLLVERLPVVEGTDLQELEQGVQLLDTVLPIDMFQRYNHKSLSRNNLHGRAGKTPSIFAL